MITLFSRCIEKISHRKDFYCGLSRKNLTFYQLGQGYLERFSALTRLVKQGPMLDMPACEYRHLPLLEKYGQRLSDNSQQAQRQLTQHQTDDLAQPLSELLLLSVATISASADGLVLAATLYSKQQSYDRYRQFLRQTTDFPSALWQLFEEAQQISQQLIASKQWVTPQGFMGQKFAEFDGYRQVMNRLYVLINMALYLLEQANIDGLQLADSYHRRYLRQLWPQDEVARREQLQLLGLDPQQVGFIQAKQHNGYQCYFLSDGNTIPFEATDEHELVEFQQRLSMKYQNRETQRSQDGSINGLTPGVRQHTLPKREKYV